MLVHLLPDRSKEEMRALRRHTQATREYCAVFKGDDHPDTKKLDRIIAGLKNGRRIHSLDA